MMTIKVGECNGYALVPKVIGIAVGSKPLPISALVGKALTYYARRPRIEFNRDITFFRDKKSSKIPKGYNQNP